MGGKDKKGQRTKGNVKVSGNSLIFGRHLFTLNFGSENSHIDVIYFSPAFQ